MAERFLGYLRGLVEEVHGATVVGPHQAEPTAQDSAANHRNWARWIWLIPRRHRWDGYVRTSGLPT